MLSGLHRGEKVAYDYLWGRTHREESDSPIRSWGTWLQTSRPDQQNMGNMAGDQQNMRNTAGDQQNMGNMAADQQTRPAEHGEHGWRPAEHGEHGWRPADQTSRTSPMKTRHESVLHSIVASVDGICILVEIWFVE